MSLYKRTAIKKKNFKKPNYSFEKIDIYNVALDIIRLMPEFVNTLSRKTKYVISDIMVKSSINVLTEISLANELKEDADRIEHIDKLIQETLTMYSSMKCVSVMSQEKDESKFLGMLCLVGELQSQAKKWKNYFINKSNSVKEDDGANKEEVF